MNADGGRRIPILALTAALMSVLPAAGQDRTEPAPAELDDVGVTEHLDAKLPLELAFLDEDGRKVRLGDFFNGDKPVLLTLNYYRCPMLCTLQLNGLADALKQMDSLPGDEFEVVTISFDPKDTTMLARQKKQNYVKELGKPGAAEGWHFLCDPADGSNTARLAETLGFRYRYDEDTDQFAHAATAFVCTPDGRTSRYLYGVEFLPKTLHLSLVEASEGKIGSTFDQVLLFCFHYDGTKGRYAPAAMNLMRGGGVLTVIVFGTVLLVLRRREARRKSSSSPLTEEPVS